MNAKNTQLPVRPDRYCVLAASPPSRFLCLATDPAAVIQLVQRQHKRALCNKTTSSFSHVLLLCFVAWPDVFTWFHTSDPLPTADLFLLQYCRCVCSLFWWSSYFADANNACGKTARAWSLVPRFIQMSLAVRLEGRDSHVWIQESWKYLAGGALKGTTKPIKHHLLVKAANWRHENNKRLGFWNSIWQE